MCIGVAYARHGYVLKARALLGLAPCCYACYSHDGPSRNLVAFLGRVLPRQFSASSGLLFNAIIPSLLILAK